MTAGEHTAGEHYDTFWLGLRASDAKLGFFRLAFFAVFALDAWMQIGNAPRYGFGEFNVSHFPFVDALLPIPSRSLMSLVYGAQVLLALRIALGGAHRASYIALAVLFAFGYFVSQLNSYQHHYLLAIALALLAAFPWHDLPAKTSASTERFWPVRMLLVALSVMYVFAALAKLDSEWQSGATLKEQIGEGFARDMIVHIGWSTAAILTLVLEFALALLLHWRRLWPLTALLGSTFHLAIETSGLRIGLFSYFMLTFYVLLIPDTLFDVWFVRGLRERLGRIRDACAVFALTPSLSRGAFAISVCAAAALILSIPINSAKLLAAGAVVFALGDYALTRAPAAAGVKALVASLGLLALVHTTDGLRTYYHFWGHNDRRAGDTTSAIKHYERGLAIDPTYASGYLRLGDTHRQALHHKEALEAYTEGLIYAPDHFKLNRGAAEMHARLGNRGEAISAAQRALKARPGDARSQTLLRTLTQQIVPSPSEAQ